MSALGGASSFALIAFSSFLTLLISHLAVQQHSPPVVQRSSSAVLTGSLTSHVSAPVPPPPPPVPPAPPPPPPPSPPPPSQQYELQSPIQQPFQPTLTIESTSSPSLNLLTLVALLLFFGLAGLWLESPAASRSRKWHSRREMEGRRRGESIKRHSSSSSGADSHDHEYDTMSSGEYSKKFPGSWKTYDKDRKGKQKEGVQEVNKKKMGLGEERESQGYQFGFARKGEDIKGNLDHTKSCQYCTLQTHNKSDDRDKTQDAEDDSEQVGSTKSNQKAKQVVSSSLIPSDDSTAVSSATREKEVKKKVTKSVTVESVQESPSSSAKKVAGDRSATPSSVSSMPGPQSKGKGKEKEKLAPVESIETYAEPPTAMPEVAGSAIEPLSDEVLAELGKKAAKADQTSQVKSSEVDKIDGPREQPSKGKGKQKEKQKVEEPVVSNTSDAQSVISLESGKGKGVLRKGFETLSNIAKEVKNDVINEVLKELDDGKEALKKDKGKEKGKAKEESTASVNKVEEKEKESTKAAEQKDEAEKNEVILQDSTGSASNTNKKDKVAKAAAIVTSAENPSENSAKEKVTTMVTVEHTAKVKEKETDSKPAEALSVDISASSSKEKRHEVVHPDIEKANPPPEANDARKEEKQSKSKGKEKTKGSADTSVASTTGSDMRSPSALVALSGSKLTLYQQALLQGLLTTGAKTSLYHQTADYLCDLYPSLVNNKSQDINNSLDVNFAASSQKTNIPVSLPLVSSGDKALSKDATRRALDLYQLYKQNHMNNDKNKKATNVESEEVLRSLISALVEIKGQDVNEPQMRKDDRAPLESVGSARQSTPPSSTGYPDVIPLEEVNQSSLLKAGVWVKQQQNEKASQINEAIKSLSADVNKNIQYIKEDIGQVKEGASNKAKTLKSLLKRRGNTEQEETKRKPRKSVRLQDAAGRGEGPRDEARGETEQEARFRRLKEMANRLNE